MMHSSGDRVRGKSETIRVLILLTTCALYEPHRIWPSQQAVRDATRMPRATFIYHLRPLRDSAYAESLRDGRTLRVTDAGLDLLAGLGLIALMPVVERVDDHLLEGVLFAVTERGRALLRRDDAPGDALAGSEGAAE